MVVEIYEQRGVEEGWRIECRRYELPDGLVRVLCGLSFRGEKRIPWGFDSAGKQHDGRLLEIDPNIAIA